MIVRYAMLLTDNFIAVTVWQMKLEDILIILSTLLI